MTDSNRELLDRMACADLLGRYASGADWLDEVMFAGVLWDDATIDFGNINCGKDEFVALIMGYREQFSRRWHHFSLPRISLKGDTGTIEATCIAHLRTLDAELPADLRFFGRYLMSVERRGSEWRIARLTYLMSLNESSPVPAAADEPPLRKAEELEPEHPLFVLR